MVRCLNVGVGDVVASKSELMLWARVVVSCVLGVEILGLREKARPVVVVG